MSDKEKNTDPVALGSAGIGASCEGYLGQRNRAKFNDYVKRGNHCDYPFERGVF
jgi:hypothetical protein